MADKITAKELAGKKINFVIIDVRGADEVAEDGKIEVVVNIPRTGDKKSEAGRIG